MNFWNKKPNKESYLLNEVGRLTSEFELIKNNYVLLHTRVTELETLMANLRGIVNKKLRLPTETLNDDTNSGTKVPI